MTVELVKDSSSRKTVPPEAQTMGLEAAARLFAELNSAGIRYCHWKSNVRLQEALSGKTDLDLLVDPQQRDQFLQILQKHDVKALKAAPGKAYPGIENYLGFDRASGSLFHLHVHDHLVLGEQLVKNYVLPLREQFLTLVSTRNGVKVPATELELIVFCVRALLKYRDRDALKDILGVRSPGLSGAIIDELHWLQGQTKPRLLRRTLKSLETVIDGEIILAFLKVVSSEARDGAALWRLRARLRAALRPYRRQSQLRASLTYFRELWFRRKGRMQMAGGGLSLALVGADGAGKTTMGAMLHKWLSWKLDVHPYYLGSKQPSVRSQLLYLLFRMLRRSQRGISRRLGEAGGLARAVARARQLVLYSHHVSLALDRRRRHQAGQRLARAGAIVIYDRFPLAPRLDGPKIGQMALNDQAANAMPLQRREEAIYEAFEQPDYLFLLNVTPDVSLQRKPDHQRSAIEAKYESLQQLSAQRPANVICIDATQEMDAVISELKRTVWRLL